MEICLYMYIHIMYIDAISGSWFSQEYVILFIDGVIIFITTLYISFPFIMHCTVYKDRFVHEPSHWEATLQCNVVSHWLGACTKWSLAYISHCWLTLLFSHNRCGYCLLFVASATRNKICLILWLNFDCKTNVIEWVSNIFTCLF